MERWNSINSWKSGKISEYGIRLYILVLPLPDDQLMKLKMD